MLTILIIFKNTFPNFFFDYNYINLKKERKVLQMKKIRKIVIVFLASLLISPVISPIQESEALILPIGTRKIGEIIRIEDSIPDKLKKKNGHIDLGKFKDKHGNTPKTKSSGTFKSTKDSAWTVDKDTGGHGGRRWKINKHGHRVGSLDKNGKVLGK